MIHYSTPRCVEEFDILNEVGKGTYGQVFKAIDKRTQQYVALKRVLLKNEKEGFPVTAVREIKILKRLQHENVVRMLDVVFAKPTDADKHRGSVYMVFEYMDHDLSGVLAYRSQRTADGSTGLSSGNLRPDEVKCIFLQVLRGLDYCHKHNVVHRDLKLSNLLLDKLGHIKIADFGLARIYKEGRLNQTNRVITRWYRPPELLLGTTIYDSKVDTWSAGCILAELIRGKALFPGESETEVYRMIADTLGAPCEQMWPACTQLPNYAQLNEAYQHMRKMMGGSASTSSSVRQTGIGLGGSSVSTGRLPASMIAADEGRFYEQRQTFRHVFSNTTDSGRDLLARLLQCDPSRRLDTAGALNHGYFSEHPLACSAHSLRLSSSRSCHEFTTTNVGQATGGQKRLGAITGAASLYKTGRGDSSSQRPSAKRMRLPLSAALVWHGVAEENPVVQLVDIGEALPDKLCLQAATTSNGNFYETEEAPSVVVGEELYKDLVTRARSSAEAQHDRVIQQLHAELTDHGKNVGEAGGAKHGNSKGGKAKQVGEAERTEGQHFPILFIILAVSGGIFLCWVCANLVKFLPPTVAVFKLGMLLAVLIHHVPLHRWGVLGDSIQTWLTVDPHLMCFVFIPMLMFGDVLALDANLVRGGLLQAALMATLGFLISAFLSSLPTRFLPSTRDWPVALSVCFGAVVSGTEPTAAIWILRALGSTQRLKTLMETESLLGDGMLIVLYSVAKTELDDQVSPYGPLDIAVYVVRAVIGSASLGMLLGMHGLTALAHISNSHPHAVDRYEHSLPSTIAAVRSYDLTLQTTITLVTAYASFFIAEVYFGMSGVITTFTAGMILSWRMRPLLISSEAVDSFWSVMEFVSNAVVFFLGGVLFGDACYRAQPIEFLWLLVLYIATIASRAIMVFTLSPLINAVGEKYSWRELTLSAWSGGLRGGVSMALAVSLSRSTFLDEDQATQVFFYYGGLAWMSLIVNAMTCGPLVDFLGLSHPQFSVVIKMEAVRARLRGTIYGDGPTGPVEELCPSTWRYLHAQPEAVLNCLLQHQSSITGGQLYHYKPNPTFRKSLAALNSTEDLGSQSSVEASSSELLSTQRETYLNVLASFYARALKDEIVPGQPEIAGLLLRTVEDAKMKVFVGLRDWKAVQNLLRVGRDKHTHMRNSMILHLFMECSRKTVEAVTELLCPTSDREHDQQHEGSKILEQLNKVFANLKPVWTNVRSEVEENLGEAEALLGRMPARIVHLSHRYQKVGEVIQGLQAELSRIIDSGLLDQTEAQSVLEHIDEDIHRLQNSMDLPGRTPNLLVRKNDISLEDE
ncbi:hypothetical protein FOZ60_008636 [Perkinsus olseni]|uniref:Cyclin-dependent kinase 2 homolog n=1 Tax=Perkinsus olseni TaxID=32597 RepID=A0A7J6NIT7_PEROL|nr:hypothetical protein FOZ60_008636 [Perkinsus olseni]